MLDLFAREMGLPGIYKLPLPSRLYEQISVARSFRLNSWEARRIQAVY